MLVKIPNNSYLTLFCSSKASTEQQRWVVIGEHVRLMQRPGESSTFRYQGHWGFEQQSTCTASPVASSRKKEEIENHPYLNLSDQWATLQEIVLDIIFSAFVQQFPVIYIAELRLRSKIFKKPQERLKVVWNCCTIRYQVVLLLRELWRRDATCM